MKIFKQYLLKKIEENSWTKNGEEFEINDNVLETKTTVLGIQALPGTTFVINNGIIPVQIGSTGLFTIEVDDTATIHSLIFKSVNNNKQILVDVIMEEVIK